MTSGPGKSKRDSLHVYMFLFQYYSLLMQSEPECEKAKATECVTEECNSLLHYILLIII